MYYIVWPNNQTAWERKKFYLLIGFLFESQSIISDYFHLFLRSVLSSAELCNKISVLIAFVR